MKIRMYRAITPGRVLIYGLFPVAFLVAGVLAALAPADAFPADLPLLVGRGLPWLGLVVSVAVVSVLARARLAYAAGIAWYTRQGLAVHPSAGKTWLAERRTLLEDNIDQAWKWWARKHPDWAETIADKLNGCHLVLVPQDEPLRDPRLPHTATALSEPWKIRLWFPIRARAVELYLKGYEGREFDEVFFARVRHEVAHICLYAMGDHDLVGSHHERMRMEMCPDA